MPTRIVSSQAPDPQVIDEAAAHLRAGRLVAFPTETVYGLGAHAMDPDAVARIFAAKGRPAWNPVIVHIASAGDVLQVASAWPPLAARLATAFWPGPLTLVVPRRADVPDQVSAGLATVGLRVPAHPVAQALLRAARIPVAAPSANRSTELSPTRASHVERALGDRVAMILDGGPTAVGIESTVLDVSGAQPVLLRPGGLSRTAIEAVVGPIAEPAAAATDEAPRSSPGQMDLHYAPRARLRLFSADEVEGVAGDLAHARDRGERAGAVTWSPRAGSAMEGADDAVLMPADPAGYARDLYDVLHRLDDRGCVVVLVERPPDGPDWDGVRDRLERATRR